MSARVGIYPGTFDPITNGHTDIILRATKIVDKLVIGVARNDAKGPLFPTDERVAIVQDELAHIADAETKKRIEVRAFDTLLMNFALSVNAAVIIRGLRAVSDFEYEFQMAGMNNRLNSTVETVFLMASDRFQFISSRFVKEIGALGGDVTPFVSTRVAERLSQRFALGHPWVLIVPARSTPLAGDDRPLGQAPPAPLSSKQQAGLSPPGLRRAAQIAAGETQHLQIAALPRNRLEIDEVGAQLARADA
jgi:pantetheine-phosphate adenylyltransferase